MHNTSIEQSRSIKGEVSISPVSMLDDVPQNRARKQEAPQQDRLSSQQRIMVVEDDPSLASLEAEVLIANGYITVIVDNAEHAIATLDSFAPDLIVLDLELSGILSGWDVLQVIRTRTVVPVLFTTSSVAKARNYIRSRGETKSTLDHLPKPYPVQTLLKRVQRMLMISP